MNKKKHNKPETKEKDEKEEEVEDIMGRADEKEKDDEIADEEPNKEEENQEEKENKEKTTEEEINEEKKTRSEKDTKKLIILIFSLFAVFAITLLVSRYLYTHNSTPEYPSYTYNNFNFVKISGLWHTQWQQDDKLYNVHLRYGPKESEDIPHYAESASFENTGTLYITFDPGENLKYVALAGTELSLSLANTFNITPIAACTNNDTSACSSRPIITCDNTNDAVIYIKQAEQPSITTRENCLIIQGQGEDLVRAADKVLWIWYGIIT